MCEQEQVDDYFIDTYSVSNSEFRDFVRATKYIYSCVTGVHICLVRYKTDAEKFGWSFVFHQFVTKAVKDRITQVRNTRVSSVSLL